MAAAMAAAEEVETVEGTEEAVEAAGSSPPSRGPGYFLDFLGISRDYNTLDHFVVFEFPAERDPRLSPAGVRVAVPAAAPHGGTRARDPLLQRRRSDLFLFIHFFC